MKPADYSRLLFLAALWGASFIFIRVTAPALGAVWTAEGRVLIGGLALLAWLAFAGQAVAWREHWHFYAGVGLLNSAIPFTLYAYAGRHLAAPLMAILNATSPMFGLLLGALFRTERLSAAKLGGLVLGAAGVALVCAPGASGGDAWAIGACLAASFSYGLTGVVVRRGGAGVPSRGTAMASQLFAAAMLAPLLPLTAPATAPDALIVGNLVALGVLASGLAFVLYFRLMADIGAARALTVTFLIPLFGMLWGWLFLGESLAPAALGGAALILAGTALATRG